MSPRWDLGHALARWSAGVNADDAVQRAAAEREIPELLAVPSSRSRYQHILDVVSA